MPPNNKKCVLTPLTSIREATVSCKKLNFRKAEPLAAALLKKK